MTVKLALWWLHMETRKDLSIREDYSVPSRSQFEHHKVSQF